jgi:hypothetical protein
MKITCGVRRTLSLLALLSGSLLSTQVLPSPPSDSSEGPDEAMIPKSCPSIQGLQLRVRVNPLCCARVSFPLSLNPW